MSLSLAERTARAATLASDAVLVSIHTGDPGADGTANQSSAGDQTVSCTSSGAVVTIPAVSFSGGEASGPATYLGLWTASRATFICSTQAGAGGDSAFNAAGQADASSWTITEN